jgi:hypothetical protein
MEAEKKAQEQREKLQRWKEKVSHERRLEELQRLNDAHSQRPQTERVDWMYAEAKTRGNSSLPSESQKETEDLQKQLAEPFKTSSKQPEMPKYDQICTRPSKATKLKGSAKEAQHNVIHAVSLYFHRRRVEDKSLGTDSINREAIERFSRKRHRDQDRDSRLQERKREGLSSLSTPPSYRRCRDEHNDQLTYQRYPMSELKRRGRDQRHRSSSPPKLFR